MQAFNYLDVIHFFLAVSKQTTLKIVNQVLANIANIPFFLELSALIISEEKILNIWKIKLQAKWDLP